MEIKKVIKICKNGIMKVEVVPKPTDGKQAIKFAWSYIEKLCEQLYNLSFTGHHIS